MFGLRSGTATVLVVGTTQPSAHAVARSLVRARYRVIGTRDSGRLSGRTRYCARTYSVPPADELDAFTNTIGRICSSERVDVVVPLADEALGALLHGRPDDAEWKLVGPSRDVFDQFVDKGRLAALAATLGLGRAHQVEAGPDHPLDELPATPAYVKVVSGFIEGRTAGRPIRVVDEAHCREVVGTLVAQGRSVIVQEEVAGEPWRLHFARRHNSLEYVAARTCASHPPHTGQSSVSVFTEPPALVVDAARRLIDATAYEGTGSVQVIIRAGQAYPHDVNLRMPASVAGTVAAGLDLPTLAVEIALGRPHTPRRRAPRTFRYVQLEGEATALADRLRGRSVGRSTRTIAAEIVLGALLPQRVLEPMDVTDPIPTLAAISRAWRFSGPARERTG